jgi:hypothetical protein
MSEYTICTAIQQFRIKYVVPTEVATCDPDVWIRDSVTSAELNEFSQEDLGEVIIDTATISEDDLLQLFDKENDYLADWSRERKIAHIRNWRDTFSDIVA